MSREEIEKLLGGYATGTLTPEERTALFAAALEDQQLFEELAREEPLRELLEDPVAKTRLRTALERKPAPVGLRWLRPAAWAIPAVGLAAVVVMFVSQRQATRTVMIAQAPALPRMGQVEPVPSALPKNLEKRELPLMARAAKTLSIDSLADNTAPAAPSAKPPAPSAKDTAEPVAETAVVRDQAVTGAPPPPPPPPPAPKQMAPAPLNPPGAAQPVVVIAGQPQFGQQNQRGQQGQQGQQGLQGQPYAGGQRAGAAETVQVQAGAVGGLVAQQDARALFFGAPIGALVQTNLVDVEQRPRLKALSAVAPAVSREAGAAAARQIGLRYSVQRRLANGQAAAVIPNEVLDAGDQVTLNLEPNEAGNLSVFERTAGVWRELINSRVERLTSSTVPARGSLAFNPSGTIDLFVVFSREARQTPYPVPEARLDQVMNANFQERMTYVVSTASVAQGQVVAFPITLAHK